MVQKQMPGVMLYFDRLSFLDRLDDAQTGRLFRAVIRYARDGAVPEIDDVMFGVAWDVLRPMVDYDAQRYAEVSEKRRQSALRRWEKAQANANASVCMPYTETTTDTEPATDSTPDQTETSSSPDPEADSETP
ncbi:MAG: hypothetical protein IJI27_09000 [Oscillospiraceae bacterium]|nr:hypothetical protein [Oscillospiraceae bacterium]